MDWMMHELLISKRFLEISVCKPNWFKQPFASPCMDIAETILAVCGLSFILCFYLLSIYLYKRFLHFFGYSIVKTVSKRDAENQSCVTYRRQLATPRFQYIGGDR